MALHPKPILCWMCGSPADSSEHIFKARDLKRIFDEDGYDFDNLPFHFHVGGHKRIPGPKSKRMTFQKMICKACNGNRTSDFDRAYDRLSDWFTMQQANYTITEMDFRDVFKAEHAGAIDALRRYFAKALGCRILSSGSILPAN